MAAGRTGKRIAPENESLLVNHPAPIFFRIVNIANGNSKLHAHRHYEIIIVLKGEGLHITEEGEHTLGRGTILISSPEYVHGARHCLDLQFLNIIYEKEFLKEYLVEFSESEGFNAFFGTRPTLSEEFRFQNHFILDEVRLQAIDGMISNIL